MADAHRLDVKITSSALGDVAVVTASIDEALSSPTRASSLVLCDAAIDADKAIGQPAHLEVLVDDATVREFHLVVVGVDLEVERSEKLAYTVHFAHALDLLHLRADVRMFQALDAKDIVSKVLEGAGFAGGDVEWKTTRTLTKRETCVQYRESDFDFVSRLLEFEGIFYFFEHDSSTSKLVLADSPDAFTAIPGESTVDMLDESRHGLGVHWLEVEMVVQPDAVSLKDWNFETPGVDLRSSSKIGSSGRGEVFEFPGGFKTQAEGAALAKIRAEELLAAKLEARGKSDVIGFAPARWFELAGTSNADHARSYVIRSARHELRVRELDRHEEGELSYACYFACAPKELPYRPRRVTHPAKVHGSHSVVVTGASGEEIHPDKYGRMKAKFYWDRVGKDDDTSSFWIRVAQLPIGGSMTLARVGWEMAVRYVHGDPDRPVAVARTDNASHTAPYGYPKAGSAMSLKTASSPGGGKTNEIRMEDGGGGMQWFANASKDWNETVQNDKSETIGVNEKLDVGVDSVTTIGANQKVSIGAMQTTKVSSNQGTTVSGDRTKSVAAAEINTVSGNEGEKVKGSDTETVGGAHVTIAAMGVSKTSKGSQSLTVGGVQLNVAALGISVACAGARTETVGGVKLAASGGTISEGVIGALSLAVGGAHMQTAGANRMSSTKSANALTVGGAIIINAGSKLAIKADTIKITVGGVANFLGGGGILNMTPGSASFVGIVTLKGSSGVKISGNPNLVG